MELKPETPTERVAIIVHRLTLGDVLTIGDVVEITGLKRAGAYALMARVSRVAPLVLDAGQWSLLRVYRA